MNRATIASVIAATLGISACSGSFAVRDATAYQEDTRTVLMSQSSGVKSCYDRALAQDEGASGSVVVNFKVQAETGSIMDPALDEAETTAPSSLSNCVLNTLDGLTLDPADQNEGHATFRWNFSPRG